MPGTGTTTEFYSPTDSSEAQPNGTRSLTHASSRAYRIELSPFSFLRRSAYVFPDKVAIVHGERRTTYREFDQRVNRLASALRAAGVERGDRVAFLAPNIPALLEAHYGVPAAGAVLVAVNTRRDRKKDIIISGGENISTIEVEHTICRHPAVLECAVVAIPDEKWGERPKAFVALSDGQTATEREIIDFCREHLARFKAPAAVKFGPLPKTSTGKIQKYVLRNREWADRDKRVN
jgi:acyl-CoA synthetase (AMP-forming)/AMP-acid ligase II